LSPENDQGFESKPSRGLKKGSAYRWMERVDEAAGSIRRRRIRESVPDQQQKQLTKQSVSIASIRVAKEGSVRVYRIDELTRIGLKKKTDMVATSVG